MKPEETIPLGRLREQLKAFPDDAQVFFGCPDEANPLELVGVEEGLDKTVQIKFRLNVYKGSD
ncbi:MAG: hypothetical protein IH614_03695 [Desulfuromonadales bacterium]|nr:hypothetical protein [Desulfuromonadales bacterium]